MAKVNNRNNSGEIFVLAVPESRKDEIEPVNNYHFHIPPALLEGNVHRIVCKRNELIEHYNMGWDVGFSSRLTVRAWNLSDEMRENLIRWSKDSRLVFFCYQRLDGIEYLKKYEQSRHGNERIVMLYSEDCRTKVDIRPDDEPGYHRLCIKVEPYPYTPNTSFLFTRDGNFVRLLDFVKYLV